MHCHEARARSLAFIPLALGSSWVPWLLAIGTGRGIEALTVKIMLLIGLIGPALAALILVYLNKDTEVRWDFWRRVIDPTLVSRSGYYLIFLLPPAITAAAIFISLIFGSSIEQFNLAPQFSTHFVALLFFLFYTFFIGPFPEELAWRGYWLDELTRGFGGLRATLIVAITWALWHVPLLFVKGYPLQALKTSPLLLAIYFAEIFPKSVILTYIFYKNHRSTLTAIIFHFMVNFVGTIIEIDRKAEVVELGLYCLVALTLLITGRKIFFRQSPQRLSS